MKSNILIFIILFGYILFFLYIGADLISGFDYYTYLFQSILKGKLNINSPQNFDLSLFENKYYLYWGPAPLLAIMPFYFLGGILRFDAIYTLIFGLVNILVFYFSIRELFKYFKLLVSKYYIDILLVTFAFISPNFYLSMIGRVWMTNQVIAITYLLLFLYLYLKFLNENSYKYLFLSVLFFNLAWLSRYTLIFYGLLYLYPLLNHKYLKSTKLLFKKNQKYLFIITFITSIFAISFLFYNKVRFDNYFDTGFRYQQGAAVFRKDVVSNRPFALKNILRNIDYYFLNFASFTTRIPYVKIDLSGNSIFSIYPLLILLLPSLFSTLSRNFKNKKLIYLMILTFSIILLLLLMTLGTGAIQFGNRYFFDIYILSLMLIALEINRFSRLLLGFLVFYGVLINVLGSIAYFNMIL